MTTTIAEKFVALFDLRDEDDQKYLSEIPKCNPLAMVQHLQKWVALIRKYPFSIQQFAMFKMDILAYDLPDFVIWSAKSQNKDCPFVMFDLRWENLNSTTSIFLAFMMIENTRVTLPQLKKPMWAIVDDEIAKLEPK